MDEYTYKDLIINPETSGLEDLIGKEVYSDNTPLGCLRRANKSYGVGILREIRKDDYRPFYVEYPNGMMLTFICIIIKKEEPKPEYTPFKSMEEFVKKYEEVRDIVAFGSFEDSLLRCGLWLKTYDFNTKKPMYAHVSRITCEGIQISDDFFITWEDLLLQGFLFLNDTPCGKLVEAEHE